MRRELVETRRVANERVRQLAEDVSENPHAQIWMFFCECGDPGCNALVPLALDEFDRMAERGTGHVLDENHVSASFRCGRCGYGARCRSRPPRCPMCGGGFVMAGPSHGEL